MALLDLQAMDAPEHGGGGGSTISLTLCASQASVLLCL
ncbi:MULTISPECIES: SapB/AmfS family lanthipeptide [Streptomyces]|uniref:SapB/AmfS family lantipeptide n=2 Tax=Streptomyces rimosus subsp. rimosus TaxID=132474 RepID=L8EPV7_STRR1|nr:MULTISPECIES: SapB/AmfS family lanthipeptide [Streptomyces]KOG84089.1 AmfS protein [Kitasatospora aureofaciens]MYT46433.1 SapB/AmfS family lantipeptide [Streptomyces sp. SID5471]KAA6222167.1 SapB/AmfS family lantipeptide [Streptomyces albofaciens JCM 4342]KEF07528.1 AmfS protein [Streptomyces rimosus]KEF20441.1 AmfS protein [Streptomyces rimosus]